MTWQHHNYDASCPNPNFWKFLNVGWKFEKISIIFKMTLNCSLKSKIKNFFSVHGATQIIKKKVLNQKVLSITVFSYVEHFIKCTSLYHKQITMILKGNFLFQSKFSPIFIWRLLLRSGLHGRRRPSTYGPHVHVDNEQKFKLRPFILLTDLDAGPLKISKCGRTWTEADRWTRVHP